MKSFISKLGVSLTAFALVVAPTLALAQTSPINVTISTPTAGQNVAVNQTVTFSGSATGGDSANYRYRWTWSDGAPAQAGSSVTRTFTNAGSVTATLAVSDFDTTGTRSVTFNVGGNNQCSPLIVESPASAQPKAVSVTQTTAVIEWTTCAPATSRVVYDTVSHPGQNPQPGSNGRYGYAFTTDRDNNKVTTHRVTLTGLTPNTTYYFRVLSAR